MNDEFDNETSQQTTSTLAKMKQGASKAFNKVKSAITKLGSKLVANPLFWKIVLIILAVLLGAIIIAVFVSAILSLFVVDSYNKENGTISSLYGISGDKFYGARMLYKDDEKASVEIKDNYLKCTYSLLKDISQNGITFTFSLDEDYSKNENIIKIATNFASSLVNKQELAKSSEYVSTDYSLEQSTVIIDHYGFKNDEVVLVLESIAKTIKDNNYVENTIQESTVLSKLQVEFAKEAYSSYKNVCDKIFVLDYIFNSEDSTLENLQKKDYVGFVYMPKQDVTIKTASFVFVVDGGYGTNVTFNKTTNSITETIKPTTNVDITWYDDGDFKILYEDDEFNENISQFTAINGGNINELSTDISIYSMLANNLYLTYFKQFEGEISAENLLQNINSNNYVYLQFDSQFAFNFAEYIVEY